MAWKLAEGQAFNILINDESDLEIQGEGKSAYIKFSASLWGANNNPEGSDKPYKEAGDKGYEVPIFATAFGGTATRISNALRVAEMDGKKHVAFRLKSGYVTRQSYEDSVGDTKYSDSYIFHEVEEVAPHKMQLESDPSNDGSNSNEIIDKETGEVLPDASS